MNMQDNFINESNLQKYSTDELIMLAKRLDIDIHPNVDRLFIIDELLESAPCLDIYQDDQGENKKISKKSLQSEQINHVDSELTSEIPKQYNLTFIETLVRDPLWVFVYWEIRNIEKKQIESKPGFQGYLIKVKLSNSKFEDDASGLFTVAVDNNDTSRYLNFQSDSQCRTLCKNMNNASFQVELCLLRDGKTSVVCVSKPFVLPRILGFPGENSGELQNNKFAVISGLDDIPVLRNTERSLNLNLNIKKSVNEK
ncbi:MAG: DUF4912 domain-containing protein [Termitinemataceae bacterium]|nr:MAG: DUF4912 domain-containing protein [Termitinemataceae bacterium]